MFGDFILTVFFHHSQFSLIVVFCRTFFSIILFMYLLHFSYGGYILKIHLLTYQTKQTHKKTCFKMIMGEGKKALVINYWIERKRSCFFKIFVVKHSFLPFQNRIIKGALIALLENDQKCSRCSVVNFDLIFFLFLFANSSKRVYLQNIMEK